MVRILLVLITLIFGQQHEPVVRFEAERFIDHHTQWCPDGTCVLVVVENDEDFYLIDAETGEIRQTFVSEAEGIGRLSFIRFNDETIELGWGNDSVYVWNSDGKPILEFRNNRIGMNLSVNSTRTMAAVQTSGTSVVDVLTGDVILADDRRRNSIWLDDHRLLLFNIQYFNRNETSLSFQIWDTEQPTLLHEVEAGDILFSWVDSTGTRFVTNTLTDDFAIWDLNTATPIHQGIAKPYFLIGHTQLPRFLMVDRETNRLSVWDAGRGEIISSWDIPPDTRYIKWHEEKPFIVFINRENRTYEIWDSSSGTQMLSIPISYIGADVWNGDMLAVSQVTAADCGRNCTGNIQLWSAETGEMVIDIPFSGTRSPHIEWIDEHLLIVENDRISAWDIAAGTEIYTIDITEAWDNVDISPTGDKVFFISGRQLRIHELPQS